MEVIQALLSAGADWTKRDNDGSTAFAWVTHDSCHQETILLLQQAVQQAAKKKKENEIKKKKKKKKKK